MQLTHYLSHPRLAFAAGGWYVSVAGTDRRHHPPMRLLQWSPPPAALDPCPATDEEICAYVTALEGVRRAWDVQARRAVEVQWADDVAALRESAGTLRWGSVLCVMAEQRLYRRLDRWTDVFAGVTTAVAEDVARRVAAALSRRVAVAVAQRAPAAVCRELLPDVGAAARATSRRAHGDDAARATARSPRDFAGVRRGSMRV